MCHCRNQLALSQKGCIDTSPMRYDCPPLGQGRETTTVRLLFCIWLVFSSLSRSKTSTFLHFQIFPFRVFLEIYLTHFLDTTFDVSYLSRLFLETVVSGGISTTSNIYEYFGRQLNGLQRALDYTQSVDTQPYCFIP